jgi:hypothetical protein
MFENAGGAGGNCVGDGGSGNSRLGHMTMR